MLERAQVFVEHAARHAERSLSPSHVWHDRRKFHDETLVLLPILGCCQ